jgi:5-formyltetrahydrofolate cyclo-ligase
MNRSPVCAGLFLYPEIMMPTIDQQKKDLRKKIKQLKQQISREEMQRKSAEIFHRIEQDKDFRKAKVVLAYWSMPDEVRTWDFVEKWYREKIILLPVIAGDELILKRFEGKDKMKAEPRFNILEPQGEEFTDWHRIDYIIVPGVAFDHQNNRMGRGKAFYDKLLRNVQAKKVGVCFDFQYLPAIPVDQYDIPMDTVYRA